MAFISQQHSSSLILWCFLHFQILAMLLMGEKEKIITIVKVLNFHDGFKIYALWKELVNNSKLFCMHNYIWEQA
jgi:hypothetical protein